MSIESQPVAGGASGSKWWRDAGGALLRRPDLWWSAIRAGVRHAPRRWWASAPHLPVPDSAWMGFRYETAVGRSDGRPTPGQVIEYLEWSRAWR